MNLKRGFSVLAILGLALCLAAACGSSSSPPAAKGDPKGDGQNVQLSATANSQP